ncbi:TPA: hypothetical protein DCX16_01900 [bacterium]|nr:hypothetical protein [bacterium]
MKKKILIVEDDYGDRFVLERRLKKDNYDVIIAETVNDAINIIEKEHFDLAIIDIRLPEKKDMKGERDMEGGYRVAEKLKGKNIPFIFTTVYDSEEGVKRGMDLGAKDFFIKPFSTIALVDRIREVLHA